MAQMILGPLEPPEPGLVPLCFPGCCWAVHLLDFQWVSLFDILPNEPGLGVMCEVPEVTESSLGPGD